MQKIKHLYLIKTYRCAAAADERVRGVLLLLLMSGCVVCCC